MAKASCWARFHSRCTMPHAVRGAWPAAGARASSWGPHTPASRDRPDRRRGTHDIAEPGGGATAGLSAQRSVRDRSGQVSSRNHSALGVSVSPLTPLVLFGTSVVPCAFGCRRLVRLRNRINAQHIHARPGHIMKKREGNPNKCTRTHCGETPREEGYTPVPWTPWAGPSCSP